MGRPVMVGVIGSVWGTLLSAPDKDPFHYWTRKRTETDWKTACGLTAPMDEIFGLLPTASFRVRRHKDDGPLCPECLEHYPETETGKLMNGEVMYP